MATSSKQKQKQTATAPEPLIYIGPNLPGGRLSRFRVFRGGGIPPFLSDLVDQRPEIERLIVPVSGFPAAVKRAESPGTVEYMAIAALKERNGEA
ncbi:hypothetical protein ABEV74_10990 [Paenibacillus cisolokensis]|uniref:hypothetical protein n=1 Tax=Paenibacillus cisolokensis TaxID=1658519 RepID=UPI003D2C7982